MAENALRREVGVRSVERFRSGQVGACASGLVFGLSGALDEQGIVAGLTYSCGEFLGGERGEKWPYRNRRMWICGGSNVAAHTTSL